MTKQFLVGVTTGSPVVGSSILSADWLTTNIVNYIFINNNHMDSLGSTPAYSQNLALGEIEWWNYDFQLNDRLIIDITPICLQGNPCTPQP